MSTTIDNLVFRVKKRTGNAGKCGKGLAKAANMYYNYKNR